MSALLVALFGIVGIIAGFVLREEISPWKPRARSQPSNDKLDMVDEMVLYGEVTSDDFYRM